jgi:hypothetical protein
MGKKSTIKFKWLLNFIFYINSSFYILLVLSTKSKQPNGESDQQSDTKINDEFSTEYTQTSSDFVHSKRITI